jgi:hypothetical protein
LSLGDWLMSFNIMTTSFFHVAVCTRMPSFHRWIPLQGLCPLVVVTWVASTPQLSD